ncbi:hypothetical protein M2374_001078 [Citrobacter sp. JUb117]|nr:hypothetical protein [Citrobacter sp. JUb117]
MTHAVLYPVLTKYTAWVSVGNRNLKQGSEYGNHT